MYISALSLTFGFFPNKLMKSVTGNAIFSMGFARRITRLTIVNTTTYNFFYRHSEGTKLLPGYIPFLYIVGVGLWICLNATIFVMVRVVVQFHVVVFTSCSYFVITYGRKSMGAYQTFRNLSEN